jgi:APA family basic amino acid/polyamine antiporter
MTGEVEADGAGTLAREMGLLGLVATGVCSMVGAGINVIPIMVQRNVPGIGPNVTAAFALAMVPAVLAALSYAAMASAMPRAGGSYVYASRSLHPYLGLLASFSQWLGLSFAMGVVAYVLVPFVRDISLSFGLQGASATMETGPVRLGLALFFLWTSTFLNLVGIKTYERAMTVLMVLGLLGGAIVIATGFAYDQGDFLAAVAARDGVRVTPVASRSLPLAALLSAVAILFSSFIGFDSIAQTGSEARNPSVTLPLATGISILSVGAFYLLFTAAVYHAVPWYFIAERAVTSDLTAPGLLGYLLAPAWTAAVVGFSAVALFNSLPGMMLAVSRLMFAWAEDGIFFRSVSRIHPRWRTPHVAILLSSFMATAGIFGCHFAGDFFLGVDVLVIGMLVNFTLVCLSVVFLSRRNPALAGGFRVLTSRSAQIVFGGAGAILLGVLLAAQVAKDLSAELGGWYYRSTWVYLLAVGAVSLLFLVRWKSLRRAGVDLERLYSTLPLE